MATNSEILDDIQDIYKKIDQCYKSKSDIAAQITKQREDITNLQIYINIDKERQAEGKKPRYDEESMVANIRRCKDNITLFEQTITKEDVSISNFLGVVKILQDDMARPKEIVIDMSKSISDN